jgi:hypothetical protein
LRTDKGFRSFAIVSQLRPIVVGLAAPNPVAAMHSRHPVALVIVVVVALVVVVVVALVVVVVVALVVKILASDYDTHKRLATQT